MASLQQLSCVGSIPGPKDERIRLADALIYELRGGNHKLRNPISTTKVELQAMTVTHLPLESDWTRHVLFYLT